MSMSGNDDDNDHGAHDEDAGTVMVLQATVYVVWDETGTVASHVDLDEAIDSLESCSNGKLRRAIAINLDLPVSEPLEADLDAAAVEARSMPNVLPFRKK